MYTNLPTRDHKPTMINSRPTAYVYWEKFTHQNMTTGVETLTQPCLCKVHYSSKLQAKLQAKMDVCYYSERKILH